jgi:hypothetical protein
MGSAIVYSVSPQTLDEAGIYPGSDTPLAEHLCELLTATAVGNCRDFQRFDLAYATGGTFGDIPLRVAYGQPVEVVAARECPKPGNPSETAAAVYAAVGGSRFDPTVTTGGAFVQSVVPTFAESDGAETRIYVQNGGQEATSVTLTARSFDGALQRVCGIFYIAPGESYPYLASDCLGPDFAGYTVVRSGEPLAVVADVIRPESFRTVAGRATANPFDLDGDGDVDNADAALVDGVLGAGPGDPTWDPRFDFNADGVIDEADLDLLLGQRTNVATPTATPTGPTPTATPSTVPTRPHRCPCQIFLPMAVRSVS